jgi:dephospho-CoA kinase
MPFVVGLTGGIGSGKSTIAMRFEALGAAVIDADAVSHAITRAGAPGWLAVRDAFGRGFIGDDGEIDRAALRAAVFADPAERRRLEGLLHPLIRADIERQLAATAAPYTILMVPLLLEGGRQPERYARILVVDSRETTQVARVVARSGLVESEVRAIIAAQMPRAARLALADDVIDNDGDLSRTEGAIARLDALYRRLASSAPVVGG